MSDEDIRRLAESHEIDENTLRQISFELVSTFAPELRLSQPELAPARRKAGAKKLERANDLIRSAEGKLHDAFQILKDIGFANPFSHVGVPNPGFKRLQQLESALAAIGECRDFYGFMERAGTARFRGTPDARKAVDMRRTIVCVRLFNLWLDLGRKLTYTTDPISSERVGPLIAFVNDIVQCITMPPTKLSGEAIKRELDDFSSPLTDER